MKNTKPNILLIFTDQQRWDTLKAYGNDIIHTPNLDRLAQEGAVFENAITPCPICVPARACTMFGESAGVLGFTAQATCDPGFPGPDVPLDSLDSIAGHLSRAGYQTKAVGKMHFTPDGEKYAFDSMTLSEEMRSTRGAKSAESQWYDDYDKYLVDKGYWGWEKPPEIGYNEIKPLVNEIPKEHHVTQWCADETVKWLEEDRDKEKPFFLFSSFIKPHSPYDCPEHLREFYDPDDMPEPWLSEADKEKGCHPLHKTLQQMSEWDLYSDETTKRARAYYYANITFIDEQVGRILDSLEKQGLRENTMIVFTADHGDMMGDRGLWFKCLGYEGSVHIPLILNWKGKVKPETRVADIASLVDIFPTFMNAANLPYDKEKKTGIDLNDFINQTEQRNHFGSEYSKNDNHAFFLRHQDWKYLYYQEGGIEELYDLKNDPHELNDLANNAEYANALKERRAESIEWLKKHSTTENLLDSDGKLKVTEKVKPSKKRMLNPATKPYSRMPWDGRVTTQGLKENEKSWWWKEVGNDFSKLVEFAKNKNK